MGEFNTRFGALKILTADETNTVWIDDSVKIIGEARDHKLQTRGIVGSDNTGEHVGALHLNFAVNSGVFFGFNRESQLCANGSIIIQRRWKIAMDIHTKNLCLYYYDGDTSTWPDITTWNFKLIRTIATTPEQ